MDVKIDGGWRRVLAEELGSGRFAELLRFVKEEYSSGTVYPPADFVFEAFNRTPFEKVKAVIVGQDPYHGPGQAHGLSFSVPDGIALPPSLKNIYKELELEYGGDFRSRSGDLSHWADQGVLLLNATLTVRDGLAGSHQKKGWEDFTDVAISCLSEMHENLVFFLWGSYAQKKGQRIDRKKHLVLEAVHPSPLSAHRGFFGCGHFKKANDYLLSRGKTEIKW
jgi:uracil-DNA glycosylase